MRSRATPCLLLLICLKVKACWHLHCVWSQALLTKEQTVWDYSCKLLVVCIENYCVSIGQDYDTEQYFLFLFYGNLKITSNKLIEACWRNPDACSVTMNTAVKGPCWNVQVPPHCTPSPSPLVSRHMGEVAIWSDQATQANSSIKWWLHTGNNPHICLCSSEACNSLLEKVLRCLTSVWYRGRSSLCIMDNLVLLSVLWSHPLWSRPS